MKKILTLLLVLTYLLVLVGCDPGISRIDGDKILSNTEKIELFYYKNENPKPIRNSGKKKPVFDFSKATLIATLDDSCIEDVVKDIAENDMLFFGRPMNEPIGKTMILYQSDGNMVVLFSCVYKNKRGGTRYYGQCNIYDANGTFVEYLGDIDSDYVDILESKYFESNT